MAAGLWCREATGSCSYMVVRTGVGAFPCGLAFCDSDSAVTHLRNSMHLLGNNLQVTSHGLDVSFDIGHNSYLQQR
jgi:hypothetical protein